MLAQRTYTDAVIAPYGKDLGGIRRIGLIVDGAVVEDSLLRRYLPVEHPAEVCAIARSNPAETVVFGGYVTGQFGHFLLESLARLWICSRMPGVPIAWIGNVQRFNSWQSEILQLLGIRGPHIFVRSPERFRAVILPQLGYRVPDFFAPQHRDFLAAAPARPIVRGKRTWLSRSLLSNRGHVLGETDIEDTLRQDGWDIFHPQKHTITDQLQYLSSCETIAGWEGSAFHSLMLLEDVKSTVNIFQRGPRLNDNYVTIADAKRVVQHVHSLPLTRVRGERSKSVWSLSDASLVTEILRKERQRSRFGRWTEKWLRIR